MAEIELYFDGLEEVGQADRDAAESRIRALAGEHDDLLFVRVAGRTTRHAKHGDREVHITGRAKGRELVASRVRPDLSLALHDAVDAFAAQIRKLRGKRKARPPQRAAGPQELGLIDRIDRAGGFGFIVTDAGQPVYFHRNALSGGLEFNTLEEGQRIGLGIEQGEKGPQATVVVPAPIDAPSP
jgi:CspA family cold shock protein